MASELASSARPESIVTACAIANQLIEYSGEHLTAFVKTITEPIEPLASWTCIRSMLESCAIAAWLLDPTINAEQRIARTFAMRYEGLEELLKYGRCVNQPASEIQGLTDRIDDVAQVAAGLGYPPIQNRRGHRTGIGERMPNATELIRSELDEESMYRLLSAVAHGHSWAITQLGFRRSAGDGTVPAVGNIPVHALEKKVYVDGLAYLGRHGVCTTTLESVSIHGVGPRLIGRGAGRHLRHPSSTASRSVLAFPITSRGGPQSHARPGSLSNARYQGKWCVETPGMDKVHASSVSGEGRP